LVAASVGFEGSPSAMIFLLFIGMLAVGWVRPSLVMQVESPVAKPSSSSSCLSALILMLAAASAFQPPGMTRLKVPLLSKGMGLSYPTVL
jgi:hypothetical protein